MAKPYKKDEINKIKNLIKQGFTNKEIALKIDRPACAVAMVTQRKLGGNPNYRLKKTKHKHLRDKVLVYFLNHTMQETAEHFNLKMSELKSCLTVAYKNPLMAHVRKDKRRHDAWSERELLFLLKYSGVISRDEINEKLSRGNTGRAIKEKLMSLGVCSKNLNGMTLSQFRKIWGFDPEFYLMTTAGSPGGFKNTTFFKIIPWAYIDELIKNKTINHEISFVKYVSTMAMFQKWVHGENYWHSLVNIKF